MEGREKVKRNSLFGKGLRAAACFLGVAALIFGGMPSVTAHADTVSPGNYTVTVVPTYQNPDTGEIWDSGQNPGIGQMMVEAQMQTVGYVEIYDDGTIYLNVRLNLADPNIYATFSTSSDYSATWTDRSFEVTNQADVGSYEFMNQNFEATVTDFRFQIGTLNDTVHCTNYVEAMGRQVDWFCYITNLTAGVDSSWTTVQAPNMTQYTDSISEMESELSGNTGDNDSGNTGTAGTENTAEADDSESGTGAGRVQVSGGTSGGSGTGAGSSGNTESVSSVSSSSSSGSGSKVDGIKDRKVADAKVNSSSDDAEIKTGKGLDDSTGIVGLDSSGTSEYATPLEAEEDSSAKADTGSHTVLWLILGIVIGAAAACAIALAVVKKMGGSRKKYPDLDDEDGYGTESEEINKDDQASKNDYHDDL